MLSNEDKLSLIKLIHADPHLAEADKTAIIKKLEKGENDSWLNGVAGAGAGFAVSRFLKLSKNAQILLTIAGYGIGKYLLDNTKKHDKLVEYNDNSKSYKINV